MIRSFTLASLFLAAAGNHCNPAPNIPLCDTADYQAQLAGTTSDYATFTLPFWQHYMYLEKDLELTTICAAREYYANSSYSAISDSCKLCAFRLLSCGGNLCIPTCLTHGSCSSNCYDCIVSNCNAETLCGGKYGTNIRPPARLDDNGNCVETIDVSNLIDATVCTSSAYPDMSSVSCNFTSTTEEVTTTSTTVSVTTESNGADSLGFCLVGLIMILPLL